MFTEEFDPVLTFHSDSYQCYDYDEEGGASCRFRFT